MTNAQNYKRWVNTKAIVIELKKKMRLVSLIEFVYWSEHYRFNSTWNFSLQISILLVFIDILYTLTIAIHWDHIPCIIDLLFSLLIAQKLKKYQHILLNWHSSQNRRNKQQILQLSKHVRECLFFRFLKISREHRVPFLGFILIAWCKKKRGEYYLALAMNNSHLPFLFYKLIKKLLSK